MPGQGTNWARKEICSTNTETEDHGGRDREIMGETDWDWASKTNFNKEVRIISNLWKEEWGW
jgi:hypothetical protein